MLASGSSSFFRFILQLVKMLWSAPNATTHWVVLLLKMTPLVRAEPRGVPHLEVVASHCDETIGHVTAVDVSLRHLSSEKNTPN